MVTRSKQSTASSLQGSGQNVDPLPGTREPGVTLWFTGLSGAGKSTLSEALAQYLVDHYAVPVEVLDGDAIREHLSSELGFSQADRDRQVGRVAYLASLLSKHGVFAISALISPYRQARQKARELTEAYQGRFIEIYVHAPLEVLIERDTKGLYARALNGELANLTGVNDPYEAPEQPEITIDTTEHSIESALGRIVDYLTSEGLLDAQ